MMVHARRRARARRMTRTARTVTHPASVDDSGSTRFSPPRTARAARAPPLRSRDPSAAASLRPRWSVGVAQERHSRDRRRRSRYGRAAGERHIQHRRRRPAPRAAARRDLGRRRIPFTSRCALTTTRRDFLSAGAAAAAGFMLPRDDRNLFLRSTDPIEVASAAAAARPVVVSSSNGIRGVKVAYDMLGTGADPLDAVIAGVNIQELDPDDMSVGLGGLPNEDGVVQLDASCMHGPTKRAGAVGCLEDIATPSLVAKAVMDYTDHIMLVGPDAKRFALKMGFAPQNLLTEKSRQEWVKWKARLNGSDAWLEPADTTARPAAPSQIPDRKSVV